MNNGRLVVNVHFSCKISIQNKTKTTSTNHPKNTSKKQNKKHKKRKNKKNHTKIFKQTHSIYKTIHNKITFLLLKQKLLLQKITAPQLKIILTIITINYLLNYLIKQTPLTLDPNTHILLVEYISLQILQKQKIIN
jgi:hypothetical protein